MAESGVDVSRDFTPYLADLDLEVDGLPIVTQLSRLLPVRWHGAPAMLKVLLHDEERTGSDLMAWWSGEGAARVLARQGDGLLLERVAGDRSLAAMARSGLDDAATRILCESAARLHAPRAAVPPAGLTPLDRWFSPLFPVAERFGGVLTRSAAVARRLLADPRDRVVLHGDLHHGNVLDGGERGWLAIDPKGLLGERGFDFANIFRNPEHAFGADRERMARQAVVVAASAGIDQRRILEWVLAYCGLSASWFIDEPAPSERERDMVRMDIALAERAEEILISLR